MKTASFVKKFTGSLPSLVEEFISLDNYVVVVVVIIIIIIIIMFWMKFTHLC
jgi:hypothetical protein